MHYFALLISAERELTPEQRATEMAAYTQFHAKAASAIVAGDALQPAATAVRITGDLDARIITDGPFVEGAEVAGGYYVFEAENLDDALRLARDIPAAEYGAVEVWPMVHFAPASAPLTSDSWLALLLEPSGEVATPGSAEWNEKAQAHVELGKVVGDRVAGGAPLHPPSTATAVRVRDGQVLLTDGPYVEGAEVANGFCFVNAADRDEAIKVASMMPATSVELRRLAGVSGL
jgi:hypothetical protein